MNGICIRSPTKPETIQSTISLTYLKICEGVDKHKMHDKDNIKVVTKENETLEPTTLTTNSAVDIDISISTEDTG